MNTLPLSWCRNNKDYSSYETVELPLSGITWVATAEVPFAYSAQDLYQELTTKYPEFVLRGLSYDSAKYFSDNGADVIQTGAEAVVDLGRPEFLKHSVLELAKRGQRHGNILELSYTEENKEKLRGLIDDSSHGKEPRLLNLYRTGFDKSVRCFVLAAPGGIWLGAVTVSVRGESYVHTESILRKNDAPVGVMEALFVSVIKTLKKEGYRYFSLGDVPFVPGDNQSELSGIYLNKLFFRSRLLLGRSFDYKGLYNFKNKFGPKWSPIYLAAKPGLSKRLLIDLYIKSRIFNLSIFKLLDYAKALTPKHIKIT